MLRFTFALVLAHAVLGLMVHPALAGYMFLDLHPAGFKESDIAAMDNGAYAGYGTTSNNSMRALLWPSTSNSVINLHPAGYASSRVLSISGTTQVGVGSIIAGGRGRAMLWNGSAATFVSMHPAGYDGS